MPETTTGALVLTADDFLRADVLRLAAAAGVGLDVVEDVQDARWRWVRAPVVLVGADLAADVADSDPGRRSQVFVVTRSDPPDDLYRLALACGADGVVVLPKDDPWLVDLLTDANDGFGADGTLVAVVGGHGGAGATTFAAALSQVLSVEDSTLLVDADPRGAGIDQVLGLDDESGVRWDGLARSAGRLSARSLRDSLPRRRDLAVLGWPPNRAFELPLSAGREALSAARRGFGMVVVDLPRHRDPFGDEVLARADCVVVVSTTHLPAVAAAVRTAALVPRSIGRVVLRGRGTAADEELLGLPVIARMANQRGLDEAISLGLGPLRSRHGPLARAASRAADHVLGLR